ncbi:class I SAM-dependent methyltransferase [Patescibacteria group bacterium]|nr:class I SAM-dependent methyltransferase [Patescibacteria group bacterium]
MKYSKFSLFDLPYVFGRSFRGGKSIPRIFLNLTLKRFPLSTLRGEVIDLGAKSKGSSYNRYLKSEGANFTYCDYFSEAPGVKKMDLEKPFPVDSGTVDFALCFNTLEHVFNTGNLLSESARILKQGGHFIGSVPFLYPYHADPDDYYRYSHSSLKRLFEENGFEVKSIRAVGLGPLTLGFQGLPCPRLLAGFWNSALFVGDFLMRWYTRRYEDKFTLEYIFEAIKK